MVEPEAASATARLRLSSCCWYRLRAVARLWPTDCLACIMMVELTIHEPTTDVASPPIPRITR
jgi:hypothetical protein